MERRDGSSSQLGRGVKIIENCHLVNKQGLDTGQLEMELLVQIGILIETDLLTSHSAQITGSGNN